MDRQLNRVNDFHQASASAAWVDLEAQSQFRSPRHLPELKEQRRKTKDRDDRRAAFHPQPHLVAVG